MQTHWSQMPLLHQEGAPPWHGVIIAPPHVRTQAWAHVVLCSRDLDLAHDTLVDS